MNKLITKIVGVSLGLALAAGVGVGVALSNRGFDKAEAAEASSLTMDTAGLNTDGVLSATVAKASGSTAPLTGDYGIRLYANNTITITCSSNILSMTIPWTKNPKKDFAPVTADVGTYTHPSAAGDGTWSGSAKTIVLTVGTGQIQLNSIGYTIEASTDPTLFAKSAEYAKVGTNSFTVSYENFSSAPTINAASDDTSVATVTSSVVGSGGTAAFTVTGVAEGTATVTFSASGATSVSTVFTVYEEQSFTRLTSNAKIVSGSKILIAKSGSATIMSNTQGSSENNRGTTSSTPAGESDYSTLTTCNDKAGVFTITAGTGTFANYYLLYDTDNAGYLEWYNSKLTIYSNIANACYWSITIGSNGVATITNYSASSYVIKHNGSNFFSCYTSGQNDISLYELSSDVPVDVALSSISASNASVQEGSVLTFSGTYLPANATESIDVTLDDTYATAGDVTMTNGTFTVAITGVSVTSGTTLSFAGSDGHGSASVTLVVTAYTATHTLVEQPSWLSDGTKVIIGCTDTGSGCNYSAEKSTGASNLNGVVTGFASDKSTLAAAETSQEFVVWLVDATNGYYVFSDGGYYLAAPSSKNNNLERTDVLSERCYFTLTAGASGVTITSYYAAMKSWEGTYTIQFNSSTSKFSLYPSAQKAASLYKSNTAADPIQGFIDVFMHMDTYTSNSGRCSDETHHYYSDAKNAFTNHLSASERESFCTRSEYAAAYARLSAWAAANGDVINSSYELAQASRINLINGIGDNTKALTVIVITAVLGFTTIGGYFLLRKKKEER